MSAGDRDRHGGSSLDDDVEDDVAGLDEDVEHWPGRRTRTAEIPRRTATAAEHDVAAARRWLGDYGRLFGRSFDGVRLHTGTTGHARASAVGANAVTVGRDIYFAPGAFAPDTPRGREIMAHELAHVIQQEGVGAADGAPVGERGTSYEREASAAASAVLAGRAATVSLRAGAAVAMRDEEPIDVKTWLSKYGAQAATEVGSQLADMQALPLGSSYVSWKSAASGNELIKAAAAPITGAGGELYGAILAYLAGEGAIEGVNRGRDADASGMGPDEYKPGVATELRNMLVRQITASFARMTPRYVQARSRLANKADEEAQKTDPKNTKEPPEPTADQLIPSHPLDMIVAPALIGKLNVDLVRYRQDNPGEAAKTEVPKIRKVTVAFDIDAPTCTAGTWNWLTATPAEEPCNEKPTPEEVAAHVYGNPAGAAFLTSASPRFGFMQHLLVDSYRDAWLKRANELHGNKGFPDPNVKDPSGIEDPAAQVLIGPNAEETAKGSASKTQTKLADKAAIAQAMRQSVRILGEIAAGAGKLKLEANLGDARKRVEDRAQAVMCGSEEDAKQWASQAAGQLGVLTRAGNGVAAAVNELDRMSKGVLDGQSPAEYVVQPIQDVARGYVEAASVCDLVDVALGKCDTADGRSKAYPAACLEALLNFLRPILANVAKGKSSVGKDAGQQIDAEAKLRVKLSRLRELLVADPKAAQEYYKEIEKEIEEFQFRAICIANIGAIESGMEGLKSVGVVDHGRPRNSRDEKDIIVSGGSREAKDLYFELHNFWVDWKRTVYEPAAKDGKWADAKKKFDELQARPEWRSIFERVQKTVKDDATFRMWATLALLVGIGLVTAGVGTYVGAAAGAAWGATAGFVASTAAEAATFTVLSREILGKPPQEGVVSEFLGHAATFGIVKGASLAYKFVLGAARASTAVGKGGELLMQVSLHAGMSLKHAEGVKRESTGQGLSPEEQQQVVMEALVTAVAMFIGERVAHKFLEGMHVKGKALGDDIKAVNQAREATKKLAAAAQGGKDAGKAKAVIDSDKGTVAKEREVINKLDEAVKDPAAAKKKGYEIDPADAKAIPELKAELDKADAMQETLKLMSQVEPAGPNAYLCEMGKLDGLKAQHEKVPGTTVTPLGADPVTGAKAIQVKPKEGPAFRIEEKVSSATKSEDPAAGGKSGPEPAKPAPDPKGRVNEPVKGLYEGVDPKAKVTEWSFSDSKPRPDPDPHYAGYITVKTNVTGPNKDGSGVATGWIERAYNPSTKTLLMKNAFLEDLNSWVNHGGPSLKAGKGTPTVTYLSIRQMKLLGIDYAGLTTVKMTTIQNVRAVIELAALMKQGMSADEAIVKTHSYAYGSTTVIQSGLTIVKARVGGDVWRSPLRDMMEHYETGGGRRAPDPDVVAKHDAMLQELGKGQITRDTEVMWNYDVILDVKPFEGGN